MAYPGTAYPISVHVQKFKEYNDTKYSQVHVYRLDNLWYEPDNLHQTMRQSAAT